MKKFLTPYTVLLYSMQIAFIAAVCVIGAAGESEPPAFSALIIAALVFGVLAGIFGFLNLVFGIMQIFKPTGNVYKNTMIFKIALVPFFVIHFVLCMLMLLGFINPFLLPYLFVVVPVGIFLTYAAMFVTSAYNLGRMAYLIKSGQKTPFELAVYIVFHFIFVLDVVGAVMLYAKYGKEQII